MALAIGALPHGQWTGCHSTPIDADAPPHGDRKLTDKTNRLSYPYGVLVNLPGRRFFDEGEDFQFYTYAKLGGIILNQPGGVAYQIFDAKVADLLEGRYKTGRPIVAYTLGVLVDKLPVDRSACLKTLDDYDAAIGAGAFDPAVRDGLHDQGAPPGQVQLGAASRYPALRGLPGHGRDHLHLRRGSRERTGAGHQHVMGADPRSLRLRGDGGRNLSHQLPRRHRADVRRRVRAPGRRQRGGRVAAAHEAAAAFRRLLSDNEIIVAPGAYDGLSARLAARAGFRAVYATGGGIARSLGYPDLGLLGMSEVVDHLVPIVESAGAPVIADADTGYGNALCVHRTVRAFERIGVAALHLEDQTFPKRCGHLYYKTVVPTDEMVQNLRAARDAVGDGDLVLIARTDALAVEGLDAAIDRAHAYAAAGADVVFVEAPESLAQIEAIAARLPYPKLINMFLAERRRSSLPSGCATSAIASSSSPPTSSARRSARWKRCWPPSGGMATARRGRTAWPRSRTARRSSAAAPISIETGATPPRPRRLPGIRPAE